MSYPEKKGLIFKFQRYAIQDGPGIRTSVFLKGCPLRCKWCSNPESWFPYQEIFFRQEKCFQCGDCIYACPRKAITWNNDGIQINRKLCDGCGKCVAVCPTDALSLVGRYFSLKEVMEEIEKDVLFYYNSGGGVTLTGGEPTMQIGFVAELAKRLQKERISVALDTCGYASWDRLIRVLEFTDVVLYDFKVMDPNKHKELTGVENDLILQNAIRISRMGIPIIARLPIIPGFNDSEKEIENKLTFLQKLETVVRVDLLPY
ncbi:glycyl-radical enzyme activating protein, partial [Candidatus Aerophobetes bacterium]|nr:glycyl-radical enzyme activating protein [Candidatus Aerophobetes bacterium]